ncbi:DIX domain containing protein [Nitzschia inconspicua]|uniref:DIX domain containing protein n=1 Tax=Nitzschia inconspicua TaxID=303405 RepID=A0A9K3KXW1_9STRA|nr:DIX domain containing protein [Nitzschia inconspicua]
MTTIRYFIPEDGDSEMQPNVFLAPKPRHPGSPPTLGQLKDAFPLPGQYHFRFKAPLAPGTDREKGAMAVWMDVVDERQPVPTWQNGIIVKVTRVSMEDDDDDDDDDDHHHHHHNNTHHHTPAPQRHHAPAPAPQPSRAPPAHSTSIASTGSAASVDDLFGSPPVPAAPTSGGSLLDFNDHASTPAPAAAAHADFLGMMAPTHGTPAPPPPQAPQSGGYPGNPNMYSSQTQQQQQQQPQFNTGYTQQQQQGGAFGGLGTPWK